MGVPPFPVDYSVLDYNYIAWEVRRLHLNCSGGSSGMRVEHLFPWFQESTREKEPDATQLLKVVAIL